MWATDSTGTPSLTARHVEHEGGQVARALGCRASRRTETADPPHGRHAAPDTDARIAWADGHVHIVRDTLNADAEHAIYWDNENRGLLTGHPVARTNEVTAKGDSIQSGLATTRSSGAGGGDARIDFTSADTASKGETNSLRRPVSRSTSKERADSSCHGQRREPLRGSAPPGKIPEDNVRAAARSTSTSPRTRWTARSSGKSQRRVPLRAQPRRHGVGQRARHLPRQPDRVPARAAQDPHRRQCRAGLP